MNNYIVAYDVETTGLNPKEDFIIQLSMIKFEKDTFNQVAKKNWYIKPAHNYTINPQAQAVHGISKEWLDANGIYLKDIISEIDEMVKDSDFLTYNGNSFDIKFLYKDLQMWGYELELENRKYYDSFAMECRFAPRDLSSVYKKYTGETLSGAHNAMADVEATIRIFMEQMTKHKIGWGDINDFQENTLLTPDGSIRNAAAAGEPLRIVFNVGKYKDSEFMEICAKDPGYIKWYMENIASNYTKKFLKKYYSIIKKS